MVTAACGDESVVAPEAAVGEAAVGGAATVASAIGTDSTTGATIETNKDDYSPGEVVHLTGRGWAPNETVHLFMTEAPDTHGDVTQSVVADASGAFTLHFYDVQTHDLGVTFTLTATGTTSGSKAVVVFTDGNVSFISSPASLFTTLTLDEYKVSSCAGTPSKSAQTRGYNQSIGLPDKESIKITIPAVAGYTYAGYTSGGAVITPVSHPSNTTLCVEGFQGNGGVSITLNYTAVPGNTPPTADAEAAANPNEYAGDEGSAIAIAGSGSDPDGGAAVNFLWTAAAVSPATGSCTFASATSASTTVTCTDNGTYTLTLKVTDDESTFTTSTATLIVANVAPATPTITAPSSVPESNTPFNFSASSNDVSSVDVAAGLTFAFSCDDGATFPNGFSNSSSGQCTPADGPGTVKIAVKAKDKDGAESLVAKHSVTVTNVAPTATLNAPASANAGASFQIELVSPSDPSSVDVTAGFQYALDCGSGTFTGYSPTTTTATCTAGLPPSVTVRGKIKDKDGDSTIVQKVVAVSTVPPLANAGGPYSGNEASPVNISGSGSDPDGGAVTFLWTAAANSPAVGSCTFESPTSASTTVTCTDNGTYTLTLTVSDNENTSTQSTTTLTLANVAPATPTITAPSTVPESSTPFNFSAPSNDVSSVDVAAGLTFAFSCDDGATFPAGFTTSSSGQCTPADGPGTVKIAVKARDKDGGESLVARHSVTVTNVAPTATFGNNGPVDEGSSFTLTLTNPVDVPNDLASLTYAFDCGTGYGSYGSATSAVCPTTDNGTRNVKGKVKDKDGGESEYTASVTVNNVAPTATFTSPTAAIEGATFQLSFSGATDVSSADVAAGFKYDYDCGAGFSDTPTTDTSHDCTALDGVTPPVGTTVKGRVYDKDGGFTEYTGSVTISNVAPTATFGNNGPVNEGSSFTLALTDPADVQADLGSLKYAFDCGSGYGALGATASVSCPTTDNGSRSVKGQVQDKDGGFTEYSASVTVNNVAPTVTLTGPTAANEGETKQYTYTFTDPGADTWTRATSCGTNGVLSDDTFNSSSKSGSFKCTWPDDASVAKVVSAQVTDDDGGSDTETQSVMVSNVLPVVTLLGATTANEGETKQYTYTFTDPGADPWTATPSCGANGSVSVASFNAVTKSGAFNCTWTDNYVGQSVSATVNDDDGPGSASTSVTISNVAPTLHAIGSTIALAAVNQTVNITLAFSDPAGTSDTYQALVNWDDGTPVATVPVAYTNPTPVTVSRTFAAPGVYRVCANIRDDDNGLSSELCYEYLVVYDPTGGFVTGGGWITSPVGAYRIDPTLTGKATFGFVSKYLRGATTPTGNTEFQFHAGRLNFSSTSYQWLVVSGPQAQFKGVGTVNGASGYGFLLSARDGSPDRFRIKIWLISTGAIVYDNQLDDTALDDAPPATALGGGSIVIHNK